MYLNGRNYTGYDLAKMEEDYYMQRDERERKAWADAHYREFRYAAGGKLLSLIYIKRNKINPALRVARV